MRAQQSSALVARLPTGALKHGQLVELAAGDIGKQHCANGALAHI
jgi:hypothetical protein